MSKQIKIYKIWSVHGDLVYIGSTHQPLCKRFANHKYESKRRTNNKKIHGCKSHILFSTYGIDNCKIELLETFECLNIEE